MPTTQTQTNQPWSGAVPFIKYGLKRAQDVYKGDVGFKAPDFQTYVPFSSQTQGSLDQVWNLAQQGNPLAGSSMATVGGMLAGGAQDQRYNQLYQQAGNPYYEQAVQGQVDKTAADVQRQFGGLGRIGSAADTGALTSQIGDVRQKALAEHWDQNVANQRGILGDQSYAQRTAVEAAPGAYQQQYLPAERMGQVGAAYDDRATRQLQSKIDKFNTWQQRPWNQLNAYNQAVSGTGATSPSFAQQKVSQPTNWLGILAGTGLTAASILSGGGGGGIDYSKLFSGL
jgi:hypothetical protein